MNVHKAGSASNHNVLDIRKRFELRVALEDGRLLPNAKVFEEPGMAVGCKRDP